MHSCLVLLESVFINCSSVDKQTLLGAANTTIDVDPLAIHDFEAIGFDSKKRSPNTLDTITRCFPTIHQSCSATKHCVTMGRMNKTVNMPTQKQHQRAARGGEAVLEPD